MEAMLAGMLGGQGAAGGPDGGAEAAPGGAEGQPSMEDLMALLQMYENNPEDAPPELGVRPAALRAAYRRELAGRRGAPSKRIQLPGNCEQ